MVVRLFDRHAELTLTTAGSCAEAQCRLHADVFDLIILDLGLPDGDGLTLLARLRERGSTVPVLVVSGSADATVVVQALRTGADDFLFKSSLAPAELEVRVEAALRRGQAARTECTWEDVGVELLTGRATIRGEPLALSPIQLRLLAGLVIRAPHPVAWEDLAAIAWASSPPSRGSFDNQLLALRRNLLPHGIDVAHRRAGGYALVRATSEEAGCALPMSHAPGDYR